MTIILPLVHLKEFQTLELLEKNVRSPNTYIVPMNIAGNSLLSSVYVKSMDIGATLKINYWDYTTGERDSERYELQGHDLITPAFLAPVVGYTDRLTVTRIHNKPLMEAIVSGGNVEFGIFITVVSAFASDLDAALLKEGELADFTRNQGLPPMTYEISDLSFHFLRSLNGRLMVDTGNQVFVPANLNRRVRTKLTGVAANVYGLVASYTVPVNATFSLISAYGYSNCDCIFEILINGSVLRTCQNNHSRPQVDLGVGGSVELTAGDTVEIYATNKSVLGTLSDIEGVILGVEV